MQYFFNFILYHKISRYTIINADLFLNFSNIMHYEKAQRFEVEGRSNLRRQTETSEACVFMLNYFNKFNKIWQKYLHFGE